MLCFDLSITLVLAYGFLSALNNFYFKRNYFETSNSLKELFKED